MLEKQLSKENMGQKNKKQEIDFLLRKNLLR